MTTYNKQEVIELGIKRIKRIRMVYISLSIVMIAISIALFVAFFANKNANYALTVWGTLLLLALIFPIVALAVSTNPLREGANEIWANINSICLEKSKIFRYKRYWPQFDPQELFQLLSKNDSVQYYGEKDVVIGSNKRKRKNKGSYKLASQSKNKDMYDEVDNYLCGKTSYNNISEDAKSALDDMFDDN